MTPMVPDHLVGTGTGVEFGVDAGQVGAGDAMLSLSTGPPMISGSG
ncbi:hypothetical protein [Nonomuraea sp. NPDC049480]